MREPNSASAPRLHVQDIDPALRERVWSDILNEQIYSFEVDYPTDFKTGSFDGTNVDHLRIGNFKSDPMHIERLSSHVSRDAIDYYLLIFAMGGDIKLKQRDHEVLIHKGQFTFVSTTEPSSYWQKETEQFHTLLVPGSLIRDRKPDADDHVGGDFQASGLQTIFSEFATSFCRHASHLDPNALRRTHDNLLDMLTLVLEHTDATVDGTAMQAAHRRRILNLIERSFRNPEIGLAWIARTLDLSPRYVQQILAARGETVSDLLRTRRMTEACRLLDRRDVSRASIGTIAYAIGYTDPAYFSRVFRRSMDMSPLDYASRLA